MLRQKFTVQVTTLADCDDITRFDGNAEMCHISVLKLFILSVPIIILHLFMCKKN